MKLFNIANAAALVLALWVGAQVAVRADVPRLISYQGKLTDTGGTPVAGTANLTFRLYSVANGGVAAFTETHNNVPVTEGLFTVMIGANTVGGVPDSALSFAEVWLGISVGAEAELAPRTRLVSVPYAMKGRSAEQLVTPDTFTSIAAVGATGSLEFTPRSTPLILGGHDNNVARAKRTWIGHSAAFPNWGIQYRDLLSDSLPAESIEFISGDPTKPRFGFELSSSRFSVYDNTGQAMSAIGPNGSGGGALRTLDELGNQTTLLGSTNVGGGGLLHIHMNASIWPGVAADGDDGNSGRIDLKKASDTTTIRLDGHNGGNGAAGEISMYDTDGTETVDIIAAESGAQGSTMRLRQADGVTTFDLDADFESTGARLGINGTQDASLAGSTSGVLMLGPSTGANILMDTNEIIARSNGVAGLLHLQAEGGAVAIGAQGITPPAGYILAVDGKAIFEEVEVQMSEDWPDYVFQKDYKLQPLPELEQEIQTLGHLPGIPSAKTVKSGGVALGSMQAALLRKIEELTLHVINTSKDVDALRSENSALRERVKTLETEVR